MKRTEYVSFDDKDLATLLASVGATVSTLELIDDERDLDVMVLSKDDWEYLIGQLEPEDRQRFEAEDADNAFFPDK